MQERQRFAAHRQRFRLPSRSLKQTQAQFDQLRQKKNKRAGRRGENGKKIEIIFGGFSNPGRLPENEEEGLRWARRPPLKGLPKKAEWERKKKKFLK